MENNNSNIKLLRQQHTTQTQTLTQTQTNKTEEQVHKAQWKKTYDETMSASPHPTVGVRLDSPLSSTEVDSSSTSSTSDHTVDDIDSDGVADRGPGLTSNLQPRKNLMRHPPPQINTEQFHSQRVEQMPMHELQCLCCRKEFIWKAVSMDDRRPRVLRCFHRICGACVVDLNRRNAESVL